MLGFRDIQLRISGHDPAVPLLESRGREQLVGNRAAPVVPARATGQRQQLCRERPARNPARHLQTRVPLRIRVDHQQGGLVMLFQCRDDGRAIGRRSHVHQGRDTARAVDASAHPGQGEGLLAKALG